MSTPSTVFWIDCATVCVMPANGLISADPPASAPAPGGRGSLFGFFRAGGTYFWVALAGMRCCIDRSATVNVSFGSSGTKRMSTSPGYAGFWFVCLTRSCMNSARVWLG